MERYLQSNIPAPALALQPALETQSSTGAGTDPEHLLLQRHAVISGAIQLGDKSTESFCSPSQHLMQHVNNNEILQMMEKTCGFHSLWVSQSRGTPLPGNPSAGAGTRCTQPIRDGPLHPSGTQLTCKTSEQGYDCATSRPRAPALEISTLSGWAV